MTLTPDNLDHLLADLTAPPADTGDLWRKALESPNAQSSSFGSKLAGQFAWGRPNPVLAAILVIAIGGFIIWLTMPALSGARQSARQLKDSTQVRGIQQGMTAFSAGARRASPASPASSEANGSVRTQAGYEPDLVTTYPDAATSSVIIKTPSAGSDSRSVIRKATIELITGDVRAAFAKAAHLPSDASGEYVQDSALTGEGKSTQAQLTLRITVARLSSTLDQLRQLGTVRSENSGGEDVTSQAIDLDARIRNEQRVESELLQLLEKRTDAPLKDILELRTSLNEVRQSIERLVGERQRLTRLVDLATILVLIRAPQDPEKPATISPPPTLSDYFSSNISSSFRRGVEFLADTLANLLALALGGLVWWLLLTTLIYAILRHRRAALAKGV